jgi:hypothetical protein
MKQLLAGKSIFAKGILFIVPSTFLSAKFAPTFAARLDQAGMLASSLCALHCMAMPIVVGVLPLLGLSFLADEQTEWTLIAVAFLLGLSSLLPGYWRRHRRWEPLAMFALGAGLIMTVRLLFEESQAVELIGVALGGLCLMTAHALNLRYSRFCAAKVSTSNWQSE